MSLSETSRPEYTVLARRFRPQAFAEVVGQEHVAQTLRNSIAAARVGHAFLFTGARGVGKTSMARILAKSLNCPNAVGPDPCNECDVCQGISTGGDVDVSEIDGASNRGIDDIRSLRANVSVKSMRSKYKIYIIDEVHMLTKEAFNALLKTLEEPPPNVKFIFCTTEPNKLPDTILSRCQRFDFGTIRTNAIVIRLAQIAEAEGKIVDQAALELVARRAGGSMRDSQSLFDQLLAFGSDQISAAEVHRLLGTAPDDRLIDLMEAAISRRPDQLLELFQGALEQGVQLGELTDQLIQYGRDLLILASGAAGVALMSVADENTPRLKQQAQKWGLRTAAAALQILADTKARMQRASFGRALAELALVRLALLEDLDSIDQLIEQLKSGLPLATPGRTSSPPSSAAPAPAGRLNSETTNHPAPRAAVAPPSPPPSAEAGKKKTELTPPEPITAAKPPAAPSPVPSAPTPQPSAVPEVAAQTVAAAAVTVPWASGSESAFWSQVLSQIDRILADNARKATVDAISGPNQLVLAFPKSYDFQRGYCERNMSRIESAAAAVAGRPIRITTRVCETTPESQAAATILPSKSEEARKREQAERDDPLVRKALAEFEGMIAKGPY